MNINSFLYSFLLITLLILGNIEASLSQSSTELKQSSNGTSERDFKIILNTYNIDERNGTINQFKVGSKTLNGIGELSKSLDSISNSIQNNYSTTTINQATGKISIYNNLTSAHKGLIGDLHDPIESSIFGWCWINEVVYDNGIPIIITKCVGE